MQNSINESICLIVKLYYLGLYVQYFGTGIKSVVYRNRQGKKSSQTHVKKRSLQNTCQDVMWGKGIRVIRWIIASSRKYIHNPSHPCRHICNISQSSLDGINLSISFSCSYASQSLLLTYSILYFWRRQWHPTPALSPGKSHGRRSLVLWYKKISPVLGSIIYFIHPKGITG